MCAECEGESRTGTERHGMPGERCYCECHGKECFGCQGLGYFMRFDLEGERLKDQDCEGCSGTGYVQPRQVPMPGYYTHFGPGPRSA